MGERTRRSLAVVAVAMATALAACGGKSEPLGPTATLPIATTTTNPYAIPQVIDEAYVNRVLAGLDQAYGDAVRVVVSTRTFSQEAVDRLSAVYIGRPRQIQLDLLEEAVNSGLTNYRQPPGNRRTAISELIAATSTCIFAKVTRDYSEVAIDASTKYATQWVIVVPPSDGRSFYNPTGWVFTFDGFEQDGSAPENRCAS